MPGAELHVLPLNTKADESRASTAMQKLADGHDTDVGSSAAWLLPGCVAAPQAGAAMDCGVAGWPPAGELAPGWAGADDDALHPVAAPISRTDTQTNASSSRPGV
jgi:hypothetical protein